MSQTAEKIVTCHPLFEQDEYQTLFRNKRGLEEAHDPQRVQEVFEWTTTAEYEALNFKREALTVDPAKACQRRCRLHVQYTRLHRVRSCCCRYLE